MQPRFEDFPQPQCKQTSVTDTRGNVHGYGFSTQFGLVRPIAVTGVRSPSAGGKAFTYDVNGFVASRTDWDGNVPIVIHVGKCDPSGMPLAHDIGLARLPLSIERIEFLLEPLVGRFAGVDRAADGEPGSRGISPGHGLFSRLK